MSAHDILVVDDDQDVRETLRGILEDEGYAVAEAADGRAALDYLRSASALPCLVVLDLMMPVMNGYELLEALRQDRRLSEVPVVVISAAAKDRLDRLPASGGPGPVLAVLQKPIGLHELLETIGRAC